MAFLQINAVTIINNLTGTNGAMHATGEDYQNSMTRIWNIDAGVNKPIVFELNLDTEPNSDFVYIYAVDNNGIEHFVTCRSGVVSMELISTNMPTGKAKFVFITDSSFSGDPDEGEYYFGVESYYEVDNSYIGQVYNTLYSAHTTAEDMFILNRLGVGKNDPAKKMEIWDGSSARFTFSGTTASSGYETAQTMDNTGYKINIGSSERNYKIALNGNDQFKLLLNNNYAIGTNTLMSITTGTNNVAFGTEALRNNTTGGFNLAIGYYALRNNTSGLYNTAMGYQALQRNVSGNYNIGIGFEAGKFISDGTTSNTNSINSIFFGRNSKAQDIGQTNQIVIGYNAVGAGSNTVTIGNDEVTKTLLKGKVSISTANSDYALNVGGIIHAQEVKVDMIGFADYVFAPDYLLMPLQKVEKFIKTNSRLPGMPSASEVESMGLNIGEMQNKLLEKIEELTLYIIELEKRINLLERK